MNLTVVTVQCCGGHRTVAYACDAAQIWCQVCYRPATIVDEGVSDSDRALLDSMQVLLQLKAWEALRVMEEETGLKIYSALLR